MEQEKKPPKKRDIWKILFLILLGIILLLLLGLGAWYLQKKYNIVRKDGGASQTSSPSASIASSATPKKSGSPSGSSSSRSTCPSTITETDKIESGGDWKTIDNKTYKFTYQTTLPKTGDEPGHINNDSYTVFYDGEDVYMNVYVGEMAERYPIDTTALNLIDTRTQTYGCETATVKTYSDSKGENMLKNVTFTKDGVLYRFDLSYKSIANSPSLTSVITKPFEGTLKSISFY